MRKTKIIFVGYAVNPEESAAYSGISIAGNKMQVNLLKNLYEIKDVDLHIITIRPVATFPTDKKVFYSSVKEKIFAKTEAEEVGFVNFPIVKQISQIRNVEKAIKTALKQYGTEHTILLTFNMFPQVGIPAVRAMKKYGVKLVSLLADLPIDDAASRSIFSRFLRGRFDESTKRSIGMLEHAVVLNKYAAERYAPCADYIVIDGGVDEDTIAKFHPIFAAEKKKTRNMVYGGSLNSYSGVITLANSMKYIPDEDIILDIYGEGDGEKELKRIAQTDQRIRIHGRVDNAVMLQKQREAYLLVNPRPIDDPISEVTFPSKIFEYMLSGTPVLSTRLNGFSDEYNGKILFFEGQDEESMALSIIDVMHMPHEQLNGYAKRAYEYISSEKGWNKQARRIYEYCKGI